MSLYALGTTADKPRAEIVRLCRQHSTESVQELSARLGSGEILVEWSSKFTADRDEGAVIASIEGAVAAFEALGIPLTYFHRVTVEQPWRKVEQRIFKNLLQSDLKTWHSILNHPD